MPSPLFFSCLCILVGNAYKIAHLHVIAESWLALIACAGIFSFFVLIITGWDFIKNRRKITQSVLRAPDCEKDILSYLVTTNRKHFTCTIDNRHLISLITKDIIIQVEGKHVSYKWPYKVQEDVWKFLIKNKKKFIFANAEKMPDPFSHGGIWYD